MVGTYDKDAGPDNVRLLLGGAVVAQASGTAALDAGTPAMAIGRHVSGVADPFNGHIDGFRISHVQRSDSWIETTWNKLSEPGAFVAAGARQPCPDCSRSRTG